MSNLFRTGATLSTLAACVLLNGGAHAQSNISFMFDGGPTATPTAAAHQSASTPGTPNYTVSAITRGNNNSSGAGNAFITSGSSTASSGYGGASGENYFAVATVAGGLDSATSSYLQFTLTPTGSNAVTVTGLVFGARSTTGTGPTNYAVRSSKDQYDSDLALGTMQTDSVWRSKGNTFNLVGNNGSPLTIRIYAFGATGVVANSANWRVDDILVNTSIAVPEPSTFALALLGMGPLGLVVARRRKAMRD